jgi:hypothetical protein
MTQIYRSRPFWGRKLGCVALGFALLSAPAVGAPENRAMPSGWRLLRSGNPDAPIMSASRTADATRSDLDLAGLILRCSDKGIETLIVVVTPFPPRTRPVVTLTANNREWTFDAEVARARRRNWV